MSARRYGSKSVASAIRAKIYPSDQLRNAPAGFRSADYRSRELPGWKYTIQVAAEALYVHPNTLRQRLRRIGELSGLDLRKDDWLMVEIAVKMVREEREVV